MSMREPKLIKDLTSIAPVELNTAVLVELETASGSYKGTIGDLFTAMGDEFIPGTELRQLLASKMGVGGQVDDSTRFAGKTEAEWMSIINNSTPLSANSIDGYTMAEIATKAEVAQVASDLEQMAGIIQDLFNSLNNGG